MRCIKATVEFKTKRLAVIFVLRSKLAVKRPKNEAETRLNNSQTALIFGQKE